MEVCHRLAGECVSLDYPAGQLIGPCDLSPVQQVLLNVDPSEHNRGLRGNLTAANAVVSREDASVVQIDRQIIIALRVLLLLSEE